VDLDEKAVPARRRRRGRELEDAVLDAAWAQLSEHGYGAFTIDAVAERAQTSRPVLYRRWPTREQLLMAAVHHEWGRVRVPLPDTGSLRADVIGVLTSWNEQRAGMIALIGVQLAGFYLESGVTPAELRQQLIGGRVSRLETVIEKAVERGEIDPARLTPRIMTLPFDLFRHELLMTLKPVPESVIVEIVDEIFLPLVTAPA
jgi:AcrR family transcriptional regulator